MENNYKSDTAYKTIGEVAKIVGLIDKKTVIYKLIQSDTGKLNLNLLNQK